MRLGIIASSVLLPLALGQAGCFFGAPGGQDPIVVDCVEDGDCPSDWICAMEVCVQLCNMDAQCDSTIQACVNGVCADVSSSECAGDSDCGTPAECETAAAYCSRGQCVYDLEPAGTVCDDGLLCSTQAACDDLGTCVGTPRQCLTPPANLCSVDDTTYYAYVVPGACDPGTGDCLYATVDFPCASCLANCEDACDGVTCDEVNGGCQLNGVCLPSTAGVCTYDAAPDRAACDLAGAPVGSAGGVCVFGACVECIGASDCPPSPQGDATCFDARCVARVCIYDAQPGRECAPQACSNGLLAAARICDLNGDCAPAMTSSCNGLRCTADGSLCMATCGSDNDCIAGPCNAGRCEGMRADGQGCSADSECINTCINGTCGPISGTGGGCDEALDCLVRHVCDGSVCRRILGETCINTDECVSDFCADGFCCDAACDGLCATCGSDGRCDDTPVDDAGCQVIACSSLSDTCRTYQDLTTQRCAGFGQCKTLGTTDCTDFTDAGTSVVCRAAPRACDIVETCDGNGGCPSDQWAQAGTSCRLANGVCDVAETCTGNDPDCPVDDFATSGECRAGTGACDGPESCDGSAASCPADGFAWQVDSFCDGGGALIGTIQTLASGRNNVTQADRDACRTYCDTLVGPQCCVVLGIQLCFPTCTDSVWCYAFDTPGVGPKTMTTDSYATNCN